LFGGQVANKGSCPWAKTFRVWLFAAEKNRIKQIEAAVGVVVKRINLFFLSMAVGWLLSN